MLREKLLERIGDEAKVEALMKLLADIEAGIRENERSKVMWYQRRKGVIEVLQALQIVENVDGFVTLLRAELRNGANVTI